MHHNDRRLQGLSACHFILKGREVMHVTYQAKTTGRRSIRYREAWAFYLCISPWLLGLIFFVVGPMLASLGISLTRWDLLTQLGLRALPTINVCS